MAEERFSRVKFIRLGAALGVGAAGASLVAACGGDDKASEEGETPGAVEGAGEATGGANGGVAQVEGGESIAQESEVEPGSALEFTDEETGQQAILASRRR